MYSRHTLAEYAVFVVDCVEEHGHVLGVRRLEARHEPVAVLKHQCPVHEGVVYGEGVRYKLPVVGPGHGTHAFASFSERISKVLREGEHKGFESP